MPQNVETGMWFTSFVVLIGVIAMILFIATIGRRVCETEWDLLNLLDKAVAHAG